MIWATWLLPLFHWPIERIDWHNTNHVTTDHHTGSYNRRPGTNAIDVDQSNAKQYTWKWKFNQHGKWYCYNFTKTRGFTPFARPRLQRRRRRQQLWSLGIGRWRAFWRWYYGHDCSPRPNVIFMGTPWQEEMKERQRNSVSKITLDYKLHLKLSLSKVFQRFVAQSNRPIPRLAAIHRASAEFSLPSAQSHLKKQRRLPRWWAVVARRWGGPYIDWSLWEIKHNCQPYRNVRRSSTTAPWWSTTTEKETETE